MKTLEIKITIVAPDISEIKASKIENYIWGSFPNWRTTDNLAFEITHEFKNEKETEND